MKTNAPMEFFEEPSKYTFYFRPDLRTSVSCVIVEDEPGPYLGLISEIVDSGQCKMAMTAPFSDKTLSLLQGQKVTFGDESNSVDIALPNLSHCVVILDMRNEALQQFTGFDKTKLAVAGIQFKNQLKGFPGRLFFATRYGRDLIDKEGMTGFYGVVPLQIKAGRGGVLERQDCEAIKTALGQALTHCPLSDLNSIERVGDLFRIVYGGEVVLAKDNVGMRILYQLLRASPNSISDVELCNLIGYKRRGKGGSAVKTISVSEAVAVGLADANEPELITAEERAQARATLLFDKKTRDQAKARVQEAENAVKTIEVRQAKLVKDGFGLLAIPQDKATSIRRNWEAMRHCLTELCEAAEAGDATAAADRSIADRLLEQMDSLDQELLRLAEQLVEMKEQFTKASRQYSDTYKKAALARHDGKGRYVVPKVSSHQAVYIGKYIPGLEAKKEGRVITELRGLKRPAPAALIEHLKKALVRTEGMSRYTGKEQWIVR